MPRSILLTPAIMLATSALLGPLLAAPCLAQKSWTGIGAIGATAMFMDTTTIVRAGTLRQVWIKSLDSTPRSFVAGSDTLAFDAVVGLNVFDCAHNTRTVTKVQYLLGDQVVFDVPDARDEPTPLKAKSFFEAIYNDLCRAAP
jgi:hypothetical protein